MENRYNKNQYGCFAWYDVSADGGVTFTTQWLSEDEARIERESGHFVFKRKNPLNRV